MSTNSAACIILQARQVKHYVTFTDKEFEFVSSHEALSATEKLIWFNLVRKSLRDPNLSCALTYEQLGRMVGIKPDTAYRAARKLKQLGFLEAQFNPSLKIMNYEITLPDEGLEAIAQAPNRGEKGTQKRLVEPLSFGKKSDVPSDKNPVTLGKKSGQPPDKNPILLIYNNINNNKHNNHNNHKTHKKLGEVNPHETKIVKDADALVCVFKNLQKEFQHLPPGERIRRINAHFTVDEINLIHSHVQKTQEKPHATCPAILPLKQIQPVRPAQHKTKFIDFEFEGATFLLEEVVKHKIVHGLPQLHRQGKIKGEAASKPFKALMQEVLFYVCNAGKMTPAPVIQLKRYHIACKILQKGEWECPRGMLNAEILSRERTWQAAKTAEVDIAINVFKGGSCEL